MPYAAQWTNEGFEVSFWGIVSSGDIEAVNNEFTGNLRFETVRYALWDMSRITTLAMEDADVEYAAATDKGASGIRSNLKGAIIVSEGPVREFVEQYLAVSAELDNPWETRLFLDQETAREWLGC